MIEGSRSNGSFNDNIAAIRKDVASMKDELALAVENLHQSITGLTNSVNRMTDRWDSFSLSMLNSIPIKAVMAMFAILVFALIGVEGADWLFKHYLNIP